MCALAVKGAQVKIWLKMLDKQNVNSILSEMKGSSNFVLNCFWVISVHEQAFDFTGYRDRSIKDQGVPTPTSFGVRRYFGGLSATEENNPEGG